MRLGVPNALKSRRRRGRAFPSCTSKASRGAMAGVCRAATRCSGGLVVARAGAGLSWSATRSSLRNAVRTALAPAVVPQVSVSVSAPARPFCSGGDRVPYADGVYEHADGSPVDITESLAYGEDQVGGGSAAYARGWDRIFASKKQGKDGSESGATGGESESEVTGKGTTSQ